jgi:hypothetical protein
VLTRKDRSPAWDGYVTAGFYWHEHLNLQVAINDRTGQVVDPGACWEYDFPEVRATRQEYVRDLNTKPLPRAALAETFGCDSMPVRSASTGQSRRAPPAPSRPRSSRQRGHSARGT